MKKKKLFGLMLVSTVLLTACTTGDTAESGEAESESQEFNLSVVQEMPSADLSLAMDTISFTALNNVYEGIYRLDKNNEPQPAGATEMAEVSEDGMTYNIKLREDAKWSNGDPVTADDYVYGWQRTVDPETASEYAYLYGYVENGDDIIEGDKDPSELGITAVNDYELEIKLDTPTPFFDNLLAFASFFPQPQEIVEEKGEDYAKTGDDSVYNGPFTLTEFEGAGSDTEWSYTANDEYWDKDSVNLDKINVSVVKESSTGLNLFRDGQTDDVVLTGELAQQNANDPEYQSVKEARTSYVELNQEDEDSPFRNKDLRLALSYAIDRESLVEQVLGDGSVASTNLLPEETGKDPDTDEDFTEVSDSTLEYDPEKAQEHWEKAKEELDIDSLEFDLLAEDTDSTKRVGEYIQGAWEELDGMKVNSTTVPFTVRIDRSTEGDFDAVVGGWGADYADPSSFTDLFESGNSYNFGKWSNDEYDKLVEDSATTHVNDPKERFQDLLDAEKVINEEMGVIPVYQKAEGHMVSDKVKGIVSHSAGAKYDYKWVSIEE
ncbi:peptide ABC transporter substrate-binding protein [Tetragenococcus halophilus]|uniref:Peptide ABC transporter substrate-binding protein n=2 Tax=Tetragenococcus halophilus TaxID=51669 RepID=A0AB35HN66_TETHA|nr:peptide ABC transporter substrate-binding protein [Tetragenococcus halophilus]MDN6836496.1 peptide ABC transporter substrate-binding protein [Lactococcus lactis]AOF48473.1 peptide ABC transporter substrate-binding protein [Tetragenococcus halophilus]MCF1675716.1 peptide ABC transporter substrate-binding protein [Tetragenococcus halophilus]MCO7027465.1 peptide ABC transporter substrate-binding protein [Tetragenococcus halophilus]MCO8285366.1 peptide ABC transporter substrate-binding protein 